jgi:hypothetical protein
MGRLFPRYKELFSGCSDSIDEASPVPSLETLTRELRAAVYRKDRGFLFFENNLRNVKVEKETSREESTSSISEDRANPLKGKRVTLKTGISKASKISPKTKEGTDPKRKTCVGASLLRAFSPHLSK